MRKQLATLIVLFIVFTIALTGTCTSISTSAIPKPQHSRSHTISSSSAARLRSHGPSSILLSGSLIALQTSKPKAATTPKTPVPSTPSTTTTTPLVAAASPVVPVVSVPPASTPIVTPAPSPAPVTSDDTYGVTPEEFAEWSKVNVCEESGNWHVQGAVFSGGLGISETNWVAYGGQADFGAEWSASPYAQIVVAMRIQPDPPDQDGCGGGW